MAFDSTPVCRLQKIMGGFVGHFWLFFGILILFAAVSSCSEFLATNTFDKFLSIFFYLSFSGFFLSGSMMLLDYPNLYWPKIYSVSLLSLCAFFIGTTIAGLVNPDYANLLIQNICPKVVIFHPLVPIVTTGVMGVFFTLYFLGTVLFLPITREVYYLVYGLYLIVWIILIFLEASLFSMLILLIVVIYLLDKKYHLLQKIQEMLQF